MGKVNIEIVNRKREYIENVINGINYYPSPCFRVPCFWDDKKFDIWDSLYKIKTSSICGICLDEMNPLTMEVTHGDNCSHSFHTKCLQQYAATSENYIIDPKFHEPYTYGIGFAFTKCPTCRQFYSFVGRFCCCERHKLKTGKYFCKKCHNKFKMMTEGDEGVITYHGDGWISDDLYPLI